jgi:hypothetical protein
MFSFDDKLKFLSEIFDPGQVIYLSEIQLSLLTAGKLYQQHTTFAITEIMQNQYLAYSRCQ